MKRIKSLILLLIVLFLVQPWFSLKGADFFNRISLAATSYPFVRVGSPTSPLVVIGSSSDSSYYLNLTFSKLVKNLSAGGTSWSKSISASPSDRVEFRIRIATSGSRTAENIVFHDDLPSKLIFIPNTFKVDGEQKSNSSLDGINLGSLESGKSKIIIFEAWVAPDSSFKYTNTDLVNTAYVRANNMSEISDSASLEIYRASVSNPELSINKWAKNLSKGETQWKSIIQAEPGDLLTFKIKIESVGNVIVKDLVVSDFLPNKVSYQGNMEIDGERVKGKNITKSFNIGDLSPGKSKTITFEAKIDTGDSFSYGNTTLVNTAMVSGSGVNIINDRAIIKVIKEMVKAVAGGPAMVSAGIAQNDKIDKSSEAGYSEVGHNDYNDEVDKSSKGRYNIFNHPILLSLLITFIIMTLLFKSYIISFKKWLDKRKKRWAEQRVEKNLQRQIVQIKTEE